LVSSSFISLKSFFFSIATVPFLTPASSLKA
jgi:hypothetical protein